MSLEQIKQHYKNLAESIHIQASSESEQQDNQNSILQVKRKRNNFMHSSNLPKLNLSESELLSLKSKLAQCICTINKKNNQIQIFKEKIARLEEIVKFEALKNTQLVSLIQQKTDNIVQQKAARKVTQDYAKLTQLNIENQQFDKQLLNRQVSYYQNQIAQLNKKLLHSDNITKGLRDQLELKEKLRKENQKLTQKLQFDMKRLKGLLSETKKYKNLENHIQNKHFVQHKSCQKQNWISEQLINSIQNILCKYNGNLINKQLSNSLVIFINKYSERIAKKAEEKVKKTYNFKIDELKRLHNNSYFLTDYPQSYMGLKKTYKNDKAKRVKTTLDCSMDNKMNIQSMCNSKFKKPDICVKILNQLRSKLGGESVQTQLSTDKINVLIDWAIQCIANSEKQLLPQTRLMSASKASKTFAHML